MEFMSLSLKCFFGDGFSFLLDYEIKRWEVVWEFFYSEVVYFMSYLLVFKEVRLLRVFFFGMFLINRESM